MTTQPDSALPFDPATSATLLVDELVAAMVNTRIYASNHPRVQGSIRSVLRRLAELAEQTRQDPICLGATEHFVVFQQRPLLGASIGASRLLAALRQWGSGGLELWTRASATELEELLAALASRPQPGQDFTARNEQFAARQCPHVRLLGPLAENGGTGSTAAPTQIRLGMQFYQAVVDLLQTVTVSVCRGGRIDFAPVQTQAELMLKQLEAKNIAVLGLARQDQYDAFTFGHSVRVAVLSMHFASSLTTDRDLLIRIGTAALLHDVGKSLIPFELLHAETTLTAEQRLAMNRHAELGAECLLDHHDADPLAVAAAFGHHRNPHGAGYPRTLHDHESTLVTSIVKICDVYEALTAARPYKQPMSPIRAYRVMLAMGDQFDRRLLRRFVQQNGIYPVGQFVELDTGEVAVVRRQTASLEQPVVAVLQPTGDLACGLTEETLFDLSQVECGCARSILAELAPEAAQQRLAGRAPPAAAAPPTNAAQANPQEPAEPPRHKPIADPFVWS